MTLDGPITADRKLALGTASYEKNKIYHSSKNTLFGDLVQSRLILERNFGGTQFQIQSNHGQNQPQIDVMFFPATHGDEVVLDPEADEQSHTP